MNKVLQVLVGVACCVVIVAGGWFGLSQYSAYAEEKRIEAFSAEMKLRRQVSECDELLQKNIKLNDFTKDMCSYFERKARGAN